MRSSALLLRFAARDGECVIPSCGQVEGDVDSVVVAPSGVAFAIETKTMR
jgi:hypothetical protein